MATKSLRESFELLSLDKLIVFEFLFDFADGDCITTFATCWGGGGGMAGGGGCKQ